jgi:TonB-linked SusC/RagA family outer membrane protein
MKFTTALFFLALTQVMALTVYSQSTRLSFQLNDIAVKDVLTKIEESSEFVFLYNSKLVNVDRKVSVGFEDQKISEILDGLFKESDVAYTVVDRQIVLTNKADQESFTKLTNQQNGKTIKGKITDKNGNTLPGVTVAVKGTSTGVISDIDGNFTLSIPEGKEVVTFSFIGFITQNITVSGQSSFLIVMEPDVIGLDEVVVIGYGTSRKADLTGSVASVNAEEIQKLATPTVEEAIQGRAAGVFVTKKSGAPGEGASIYIRGPGSVNGGDPLWIIDGMPSGSGNSLDMSQIESIDILKDAASAAIYGAKAANGVILVTTKRGQSGKIKVGFSTYSATMQPMNLPNMVNAKEYAAAKTQSQINAGLRDKKTGFLPSKFYEQYTNGDTMVYFPDGTPIIEGTDWMNILFKNGSMKNYNVNLSGGSDKYNFYSSFDYLKENGTGLRSFFERFSIVLNSDYKLSKYVSAGQSMQLSMTDKNGADQLTGEQMLRVNPFMAVMDETRNLPYPYENFGILDKDVYDFDPPSHYAMAMVNTNSDKYYRMSAVAYLDIKPFEGFSWRTSFGGTMGMKNATTYGARYDCGRFTRPMDYLEQEIRDDRGWTMNSVATYTKTVEKHTFLVMVGTEMSSSYGTQMKARKDSFPLDLVTFDAGNSNKANVSGKYNDPEKWQSYFGRISYNFDDKYLAQVNFRRDGSSKFGPNKRFGNFPSFSAGWRITNEPFMENVKSWMDLKIRAGWGILGGSSLENFRYLSNVNANGIYYSFGSGPNQGYYLGARPNSFPNKEIHWEEFNSTNIGFDLSLFQSALVINAEFYSKVNKGMLIDVDLPFSSGYYEPWSSGSTTLNVGQATNKGYEFTATYNKKFGDFYLVASGNIAFNDNKVDKLYADNNVSKGDMSQYLTDEGLPMSSYYGYVVDRLYQATAADSAEIFKRAKIVDPNKYASENQGVKKTAPGDFRYVDQNGDSLINELDKVVIGNPWPKFVYGLNIIAEYKGFDLTIFLQGVSGNNIYNYQKRYAENVIADYSPTKAVLNAWSLENPNTDTPRLNYKDPNKNLSSSSTYFVEDGSYLRLKNLQLGYVLPKSALNYLKMANLRVYVSAQNLLTLTKYSGIDPEFSSGDNTKKNEDNGNYPQNQVYQIGLQVSF